MHKPETSSWKFTKMGQKQGIKSSEKLYNVSSAITDLWCVSLLLLITDTFNGNIEFIVMEMALIDYVNKMWKHVFLLTCKFHH